MSVVRASGKCYIVTYTKSTISFPRDNDRSHTLHQSLKKGLWLRNANTIKTELLSRQQGFFVLQILNKAITLPPIPHSVAHKAIFVNDFETKAER